MSHRAEIEAAVGCGVFLPGLLTIIFLFLKWGGVVDWNYFLLFSPILFVMALIALLVICGFAKAALESL